MADSVLVLFTVVIYAACANILCNSGQILERRT